MQWIRATSAHGGNIYQINLANVHMIAWDAARNVSIVSFGDKDYEVTEKPEALLKGNNARD